MQIEKQVVGLGIAKRLQKFWDNDTLFIWVWHDNDGAYVLEYKESSSYSDTLFDKASLCWYPAPTLAEIIDTLYNYIEDDNNVEYALTIGPKTILYMEPPTLSMLDGSAFFSSNSYGIVDAAADLKIWTMDKNFTGRN